MVNERVKGCLVANKRSTSITAAELMRQRLSDPAWLRVEAAREVKRTRVRAEMAIEEVPLIADLFAAGIRISSLSELVNASDSYPEAVLVLCAHLPRSRHAAIREGIARALTVKEARGVAGPIILDQLRAPPDVPTQLVRWALANALTVVADQTLKSQIEALVNDDRYADVRNILTLALRRARSKHQQKRITRPD